MSDQFADNSHVWVNTPLGKFWGKVIRPAPNTTPQVYDVFWQANSWVVSGVQAKDMQHFPIRAEAS
jgi:hypothetical protein